MTDGFPSITNSTLAGEAGVGLVSRIVNRELGWLFRRNHNEHDFGIDGYIDIVSTGSVTGRTIAVQIKYGSSYFSQKDRHGCTYYGEQKHINYLLNHPVPVLILICDPADEKCYWEHFRLEITEPTDNAWKISIPWRNVLSKDSRAALVAIAGPPVDHTDSLRAYWAANNLLAQFDYLMCAIDRSHHINTGDGSDIISFFDRLTRTDASAIRYQGRVELMVLGYDKDSRELWEIPEVVAYFEMLTPAIKHWLFFLRTDPPAHGMQLLACCLCGASRRGSVTPNKKVQVKFNDQKLRNFIEWQFAWLNEMTERLGMTVKENERICRRAMVAIGLGEPPENV